MGNDGEVRHALRASLLPSRHSGQTRTKKRPDKPSNMRIIVPYLFSFVKTGCFNFDVSIRVYAEALKAQRLDTRVFPPLRGEIGGCPVLGRPRRLSCCKILPDPELCATHTFEYIDPYTLRLAIRCEDQNVSNEGQYAQNGRAAVNRRWFFALCASLPMLMTAGCGEPAQEPMPPYRYRLRVIVETPQGLREGSSVIQVQWQPAIFGAAGYKMVGEAVAVDLPDNQTLFVTLRSGRDNADWSAWALSGIVPDVRYPEGEPRVETPVPREVRIAPKGSREMMPNWPTFVKFRDQNISETIEEVDPDDLAKSFGPGIKLKSLTIQFTTDPITTGIEKRLPWVTRLRLMVSSNRYPAKTPVAQIPAVYLFNSRDFLKKAE